MALISALANQTHTVKRNAVIVLQFTIITCQIPKIVLLSHLRLLLCSEIYCKNLKDFFFPITTVQCSVISIKKVDSELQYYLLVMFIIAAVLFTTSMVCAIATFSYGDKKKKERRSAAERTRTRAACVEGERLTTTQTGLLMRKEKFGVAINVQATHITTRYSAHSLFNYANDNLL